MDASEHGHRLRPAAPGPTSSRLVAAAASPSNASRQLVTGRDVSGRSAARLASSASSLSPSAAATSGGAPPKVAVHRGCAKPVLLATVKGTELLGMPIAAPMAPHEKVYMLPLLTINASAFKWS